MTKKLSFFVCILMIIVPLHVANAALVPRSVTADRHIKIVNYDPNNVVMIQGAYGYETHIVFAPDEEVQNISIGDSVAWQAAPVKNNLFIKPTTASKTNMTVLTNVHSYNFQLDSNDAKISPTYQLKFNYPVAGYDPQGQSNAVGVCDPTKINWKYSFTGDPRLAPMEIFDCNGQFTYFRFKSNLPAIFVVDKKHKETLVNYHMKGNYVVVNTTAARFTLRHGSTVTSIYNNALIGDWQDVVNAR
ncbi:TrbG/VirB9 family P-type conjugative transfer protein [Rickettsiella endosymbiont of Dermanyssus gallinae]|uniref:TrbG/VirB9 family P-type conjugative transfer protein n=1 Tax=Rickettsiella endosymbiont of Dermanyssus gallinae TaxID=2856608 RepID=UPI001C52F848|nr:TrbG/VirB9 family P-type conjugative transfer protein [Rickettsiella endosymbiont of Dermanyssus gallinae]